MQHIAALVATVTAAMALTWFASSDTDIDLDSVPRYGAGASTVVLTDAVLTDA